MRALQKTRNGQQTLCICQERKSVSVGCVCVLGEPWLELLADRFLLRQRNFSVRPESFLEAIMFCFLNKWQISTLFIAVIGRIFLIC